MRPYKYNNLQADEQDEKRGRLQAMYFLDSLDDKYRKQVDKLFEEYARGTDKFPKSIDEAIDTLSAIKDRKRMSTRRGSERHSSFLETHIDAGSDAGSDYESEYESQDEF